MSVPSPCISLCQMDEASKLCKGCWRTIDEIIAWSSHDDDAKRFVWSLIEQRKQTMEKSKIHHIKESHENTEL